MLTQNPRERGQGRSAAERDAPCRVGDSNAEGPPVPIPNTEVKLCCGDDTCRATGRENSSTLTSVGDSNAEGPPVPIPNTEVKLCCGDNTCRATGRKDSSLPTYPPKRGAKKGYMARPYIPLFAKHIPPYAHSLS